jgi:hypothetical protein
MPILKIPNDIANETLLAAVEVSPGVVPAAGWFRFNGQPDINTDFQIQEDQDTTGSFVRKANASRGIPTHSGTWGGTASYERLPSQLRAVMKSGGAPTTSAPPAYTYEKDSAILADDSDTYALIYNVAGDLYRARGVRFSQFNIEGSAADSDANWRTGGTLQMIENDQLPQTEFTATGGTATTVTLTGAAWTVNQFAGAYIFPDVDTNKPGARLITGNTVDTITVETAFTVTPVSGNTFLVAGLAPAGVPALTEEKIRFAGTKLFINPYAGNGANLGVTQILQRFIGFNVSWDLNLDPKVFAEDITGNSGVYGRGELVVSGQVRLEADRPDEYRQLKALSELSIRIEQTGSILTGTTPKMARIDLPRVMWTQRTRDARNNNKTQTMAFWGYYHVPFVRVVVRNGLATLP